MKIEERLNKLAETYRAQGYDVVVRPGPEELPPFAKDFKVEILAKRADGNVIASAKGSQAEVETDASLAKYAETIGKRPGWRYDLFVLGPDRERTQTKDDVREQSEEGTRKSLDEAEAMLRAGFIAQAFIAAWAALESAMRHRLRAQGGEAGWGTSPRTMLNDLASSGVLSYSALRDLEGLFQLRSVIVHGFSAPTVEPSAVQFLVETTRQLLEESQLAKPTA